MLCLCFCLLLGSGKSNLSKKALPSHIHINQDKLKTKQKCWKLCEESIVKGQSVVIDNQNRSISDREAYVQLSKKYKIPIRAIRINMPKELCFHLNEYRALNVNSDENRGDQRVPKMVIHVRCYNNSYDLIYFKFYINDF